MEQGHHVWREKPKVTLKDVARSAGVSESLASFVLNGSKSGTRVSADTRALVITTAMDLGYRPNANARTLNTGKTNRIGFYSGRSKLDSRNCFYAEILGGMFESCNAHRMNTVVHSSGDRQDLLLDLLADRSIDGLVVFATQNDPILPLLDEMCVPAISVADKVEGLPCVRVDDREGGFLQAKHLHARGHRNVLIKQSSTYPTSSVERIESFIEKASDLGMRTTVRVESDTHPIGLDDIDLHLITKGEDRVTAVVGWNDITAIRVCHVLSQNGLRIPEDVAVVGFDCFEQFIIPKYWLTTIRAPWSEVGKLAVESLIRLINNKSVPFVQTVPVSLRHGDTT